MPKTVFLTELTISSFAIVFTLYLEYLFFFYFPLIYKTFYNTIIQHQFTFNTLFLMIGQNTALLINEKQAGYRNHIY